MAEWTLINSQRIIKPFSEAATYTASKLLTGGEVAGQAGDQHQRGHAGRGRTHRRARSTRKPRSITSSAVKGDVWLDDDCVHAQPGDVIIIPPGVFHWIDNRMNDEPFVLHTYWHRQEDNGMYFKRLKAWGKSMKRIDEE